MCSLVFTKVIWLQSSHTTPPPHPKVLLRTSVAKWQEKTYLAQPPHWTDYNTEIQSGCFAQISLLVVTQSGPQHRPPNVLSSISSTQHVRHQKRKYWISSLKYREEGSPKTTVLKQYIFCNKLIAHRVGNEICGRWTFPVFCYWHWPWRPSVLPQKLKGLRSRADFEIEFIQIKQTFSERIYSSQAVAKLGLSGPGSLSWATMDLFPSWWQRPGSQFPETLNIQSFLSLLDSLLFLQHF